MWTSNAALTVCLFYTKVNDADVFTGVDLESINLLRKYRGFWAYFEDEK